MSNHSSHHIHGCKDGTIFAVIKILMLFSIFHEHQQNCLAVKVFKTIWSLASLKGYFCSVSMVSLPFVVSMLIKVHLLICIIERKLRHWHHSFKLEIRFPSSSSGCSSKQKSKSAVFHVLYRLAGPGTVMIVVLLTMLSRVCCITLF